MGLTFDKAIEVLEITDINKISIADLPRIQKKMRGRWHPDKVAHLNDVTLTNQYTENFQLIDEAIELISSFLNGTLHQGDGFIYDYDTDSFQDEVLLRQNATVAQTAIREVWPSIKQDKFMWEEKTVVISDGFLLKDLIKQDFKEDIAMLAIISFFYGLLLLSLVTVVGFMINPVLGKICAIVTLLQSAFCFLGVIPLSRFWLPELLASIMIRFINFGLGIYHWADQKGRESPNIFVLLLVRAPVLFAKAVKYIILFPLTELVKAFLSDRRVGVVKQKMNYYGGAADWYIDELLGTSPANMSIDQLRDIYYIHQIFSDYKNRKQANDSTDNFYNSESFNDNEGFADHYSSNQFKTDKGYTNASKQSSNENDTGSVKDEASGNEDSGLPVEEHLEKDMNQEGTSANVGQAFSDDKYLGVESKMPGSSSLIQEDELFVTASNENEKAFSNRENTFNQTELKYEIGSKHLKKKVIYIISLLVLIIASFLYYMFRSNEPSDIIPAFKDTSGVERKIRFNQNEGANQMKETGNLSKTGDTAKLLSGNSNQISAQVYSDTDKLTNIKIQKEKIRDSQSSLMVDADVAPKLTDRNFQFLNRKQLLRDLEGKDLCEGIIFSADFHAIEWVSNIPDVKIQQNVGLYGIIKLTVVVSDESIDRKCKIELFYKKDKSQYYLENYAEK